jgi:hypothetical protein
VTAIWKFTVKRIYNHEPPDLSKANKDFSKQGSLSKEVMSSFQASVSRLNSLTCSQSRREKKRAKNFASAMPLRVDYQVIACPYYD